MKRRRRSSTKISHGGRGSKALARDLDAKYSIRYLPLDNNTLIYVLGYLNPDDLRKTELGDTWARHARASASAGTK
eukprot:1376803-Amorphochlora_amoeboformis.AAC.2